MKLTCYGATEEVTGSMHRVCSEHDCILLDCGLFQGRRKETAEKNRKMPIDPATITNIILSHAHIDHSGRLPLVVKDGFAGRIVSTRASRDVCEYMLPDAAHIQESDADYLNYKAVRNALYKQSEDKHSGKISNRDKERAKKMLKQGRHRLDRGKIAALADSFNLGPVEPLYRMADARAALSSFEGIPYQTPVVVGKEMTVTLYPAGHILGSAISILTCQDKGTVKRICYTGDLGRFDKAIIRDPTLDFAPEDRNIDLLIIESTYGDREHEPVADLTHRLGVALNETLDKGGSVLIPAFAYGRTQEILYSIHELYITGQVPRVPVYVDSPLASNLTKVFSEHPEAYDREAHKTFLEKGYNPFVFQDVLFTESVEESIEIMKDQRPHIVVTASGMCEFGRILHHLRYKIHNEKNAILIVGYMAENTLGRRILEQGTEYQLSGRKGEPPMMRVFGKEYPLKARVENIGGFSAHADKHELMRFVKQSNLDIRRAVVVHGEKAQSACFAKSLQAEGIDAVVPRRGETIAV